MTDYEKMTVNELQDELTSLGITFKKKLRKAELIELLVAAKAGKDLKSTDSKDASAPAESEPIAETAPETTAKSQKVKAAETGSKSEDDTMVSTASGYAIVRTGGKQYQISAGSRVRVEKIAGNVGETIELKDVLAVIDNDTVRIGQPTVDGAVVTARIVEQDKAKKVLVFKKKRRKGYRVKRGHRQMYTALEIVDITW